jgi:peptidoglycan/LPS O-acetylase OafA/YrhL
VFLLLIGLFSFYLAWSGWRYAKRRRAAPYGLDRVAAALMAATSLAMLGYGVAMLVGGDSLGVALIVFGAIGGSLCAADLYGKRVDERARIASHLTRMLAATIATLTAFLVTNVTVEPAIVIWLLPTVVLTPVIALWNRRIMRGYRPKGIPSGDSSARQ